MRRRETFVRQKIALHGAASPFRDLVVLRFLGQSEVLYAQILFIILALTS